MTTHDDLSYMVYTNVTHIDYVTKDLRLPDMPRKPQ